MNLILKIIKIRWIPHMLFWGTAYVVLLYLFSDTTIEKLDYIYTGIFTVTLQIAVYVHRLIGLRYLKSHPLGFAFEGVVIVLLGAWFNIILFDKLIDYVLKGYYFISYYSFSDIVKYFASFMALATLFKLSKEWFIQEDIKSNIAKLEKEKTEVELKVLQEQINPHFLFNSLNVLYALAIKESKESPEVILKLSDILRYVIYEAKNETVKISEEVKLINDYLGLQSYRIDDSATIEFDVQVEDDKRIAPLLFLPLIENSFKHGIKGDVGNTFVKIYLSSTNNKFVFKILNNKINQQQEEKTEGVGLRNIEQRLSLLYADRHRFKVEDRGEEFYVELSIDF